ncbi:MAG TPA: hypothetical protein VGY13_07685 [Solirubrobacteraceae bacterium]|nr:hypothetical protein [Solirubrobacteraceae bacterium]
MSFEVLAVEPFGAGELLARLRRTRLRGFGKAALYEHAAVELAPGLDPDLLAPAQRYVLAPSVRRLIDLRDALAPWGIDPLALRGGALIRTSEHPERPIPLIPPVIERAREPDGSEALLIADGLHRVSAARALGLSVSVVSVAGVPATRPYYAHALPGGWREVVELESLPDGYEKKSYRLPGCYKALFRDFNGVFPGVQEQRKRSNPEHLRR